MRSATLATPITEEDHAQGAANATITFVQYGDYECPYTRLSRHSVHQLRRELPDSLRFVFRHLPLEEIHSPTAVWRSAPLRRVVSKSVLSTLLTRIGECRVQRRVPRARVRTARYRPHVGVHPECQR